MDPLSEVILFADDKNILINNKHEALEEFFNDSFNLLQYWFSPYGL